MSEIKILHLSDIHFRKKKSKKKKDDENKLFRQDVQQKLIDTVSKHLKENTAPEVVAVTGDIAFSGRKQEYDEALKFFKRLRERLPEDTPILAVPGNHDVDRSQVNKFFSLHRIVQDDNTDDFLESPQDIKNYINVKFKAYRSFMEQLHPGLYISKGDYFWVKNIEEKNVSFLGLNSAWSCEGDNDRFNIALGYTQVMEALEKARDISNRVVLMHHPPINWLKDMESGKARIELFKKCQLLLHGHNHADNALVYQDPADACICLGANASYTDDKKGFIGLQWIKAQFKGEGRGVKTTVWPYILEERQNEIVPDYNRWRSQKGKPCFVISSEEPLSTGKPGPKPTLKIPADYIKWVREFHSTLPTDQLARKGEVLSISLPQVYIPLETANPFHKPMDEKRMKEGREPIAADEEEESAEPKEPANIDIEELMGRVNCLLLEGKAGMGKTTLIKHLAYSLTHGSGPAVLGGYLPLLVFLKDFWPIFQKELDKENPAVTFESLLKIYFQRTRCPLSTGIVKDFLAQNRTLVLLDGLDEVPETLRPGLVALIHQFQFEHSRYYEKVETKENFENHGNRFLITGRPHGIEGKAMECFGKNHRQIEYLDEKKVETFISQLFRAVAGQAKGFAEVTAGDMISDIRLHEHAGIFTRNPLLLTGLCIFYLVGGKRIPEQRADLYDRIVGNLLYRRFHDPEDTEQMNRAREFLMLLAFTMQTGNIKNIEPIEAREVLKKLYPQMGNETPVYYQERVEERFNNIEPVCGLLNRLSSGDIEFTHLSFQEFLAAKYMLDNDINYKKYLKNAWWEETLLMYTGLMNLDMKKRSNQVVRKMLKKWQTRVRLLGARALRDFQHSKREEAVVTMAGKKLMALIDSNASLEQRFEAGEILGTLGDPRIKDYPMVNVAAGEFTRGSMENEDEQPIRQIYLDEYMMGKYPVTNEEFKAFISDDGYKKQEYWTPEGWKWLKKENVTEPGYWHDRKWNGANFPVVGVSWYEADAYIRWLSEKTGRNYELPTEAQWEKAARGSKGLVYPWGNKFEKNLCNSIESGLRRTSPVGTFPAGASPYGCMDMAGNVWEWCRDWYEEDYYKKSPAKNPQGPSNGSARVFRGGGWDDAHWYCRGACRGWIHPAGRGGDLGFRLVRAL